MKNPPIPKKIKKILTNHGDKRIDYYHWLRDDKRKNKNIIKYLNEENQYAESWFKSNNVNSKKFLNIIKMQYQNSKKVLKQK